MKNERRFKIEALLQYKKGVVILEQLRINSVKQDMKDVFVMQGVKNKSQISLRRIKNIDSNSIKKNREDDAIEQLYIDLLEKIKTANKERENRKIELKKTITLANKFMEDHPDIFHN